MEHSKQPNVKILVACHKADPNIRQDEVYMPIQVGKALHPELDLGFQCDNTGDNISEKNGSYCELTALYWAWKNLKDVDYIGLCHYRRYFDLNDVNIQKCAKLKQVIISSPDYLPNSLFDELVKWTSFEDVYIFLNTLLKYESSSENEIIKRYFMSNKLSRCNMFLMPKYLFDNYCNFLFSILFQIEHQILQSPYSRQRRVIGYLAESLLQFWLNKSNIQFNTKPIKEIDNNEPNVKILINNIRNNIAFNLSKRIVQPESIPYYPPVKTGLNNDNIILDSLK